MPTPKPDPEQAMQRLGQRARNGAAHKYSISENELDSVRKSVREQWERERKEKQSKIAYDDLDKTDGKDKEIEPPERE